VGFGAGVISAFFCQIIYRPMILEVPLIIEPMANIGIDQCPDD